MEADDLKYHINERDVLTAVRAKCGDDVILRHYHVEPAAYSEQGFSSTILRVCAEIERDGELHQVRLIVKRLPIMEERRERIAAIGILTREVIYYKKIVPALKSHVTYVLPIVDCFEARDNVIIMEDLNELGYVSLSNSMQGVTSEGLLSLSHVMLVVTKLAHLHAASVDINWPTLVPEAPLEHLLFNNKVVIFRNWLRYGGKMIVKTMKKMSYPESVYNAYQSFFENDKLFEIMIELAKPVTNSLNVLNHGDFWLNNMMFKLEKETKKPIDLKFLDLQLYNFTSPTRDLLYFLYTCTSRAFRSTHERTLLKNYVEVFNTLVPGSCHVISVDEFYKQFERARLFGLGIAVILRTKFLLCTALSDDTNMSTSDCEPLFDRDLTDLTGEKLESNAVFRNAMMEIVEQTVELLGNLEHAET